MPWPACWVTLQGAEQERVVSLLQDLQGAATSMPGVLGHFQKELAYHIASPLLQVGGTGVAGGDTLPRCGVGLLLPPGAPEAGPLLLILSPTCIPGWLAGRPHLRPGGLG